MGAIKAIETEYKGHLMRSRLEARWAVFFDKLRIEWHYEEQGYELPSGRYLPDFRLEGAALLGTKDLWVEVKGQLGFADLIKVIRAACELPRDRGLPAWPQILILGDIPELGEPSVQTRIDARPNDEFALQRVRWRRYVPQAGFIRYTTEPIGDPEVFPLSDLEQWTEEGTQGLRYWTGGALCDYSLKLDRDVDGAHRAARSARFEHGQSGAML